MLRRHILGAGAAVAVLPMLASRALAQQAATTATGVPEEKQPIVTLGTYSKLASELALERVQDASLRTFAELEVAEQQAVAEAFGAAGEPPIMTQAQGAELEALRAAEDGAFDMAYLEAQIAAHEQGLGAAQDYARTGTDPMAQGAAMVFVPAIESHLVMLRGIQTAMG